MGRTTGVLKFISHDITVIVFLVIFISVYASTHNEGYRTIYMFIASAYAGVLAIINMILQGEKEDELTTKNKEDE